MLSKIKATNQFNPNNKYPCVVSLTQSILAFLAMTICVVVPTAQAFSQIPPPPGVTTISYAQILADYAVYKNADLARVQIYLPAPKAQNLAQNLALYGDSASTGSTPASPPVAPAAVQRLFDRGDLELGPATVSLPLLGQHGDRYGVLTLTFQSESDPSAAARRARDIRDQLALLLQKPEALHDPYSRGFSAADSLAQKINQVILARHPDVNVVAIHLTAPGAAKNTVWGINRPNFLGRDSDEVDTDTEKTGKIVMQVIPATHRMEVHMPLLSQRGKLVGTLCTVFIWTETGQSADFYGRSLAIMEEARLLTPDDRDALFRP